MHFYVVVFIGFFGCFGGVFGNAVPLADVDQFKMEEVRMRATEFYQTLPRAVNEDAKLDVVS